MDNALEQVLSMPEFKNRTFGIAMLTRNTRMSYNTAAKLIEYGLEKGVFVPAFDSFYPSMVRIKTVL